MPMSEPRSPLTRRMAEVVRPLDEAEERRAIETAMARLDLRRPVVHGAELRIEKRRGGVPDREVAVLLADLDGYAVHEVVLDGDGLVVLVEERSDMVPPFTEAEIAEATVVARAQRELAPLARRWGVQPAIFYPHEVGPEGGGSRRRRVGVHFLDANDPLNVRPVASVVVDLTGNQAGAVTHHEQDDRRGGENHGSVR